MALAPGAARAATCDDYPDQAAAQRAADTRDADHDGVYCEALPCPCAGATNGKSRHKSATKPRRRAQRIRGRITAVTDGDTIEVRAYRAKRKRYTVRLIGIDTPETHRPGTPVECGGLEATASMLRLAFTAPRDTDGDGLADAPGGKGRRVALLTDPTQALFDRYGRLLAYVTTRAGVSLQRRQLLAGWAKVYVYEHKPFRRVRAFRSAQRRARAHDRGVWGRCGGGFHRAA